MLHRSYGSLIYEADAIKTAPSKLSENWIVLRVCDDLVNYYQYWLNKRGVAISRSSWKPHLSVVRGEKMQKEIFTEWISKNGNKISFEYEDELLCNKEFIWLNCWSSELNKLREKLGLYRKKNDRFHLTICKLNEGIVYIGMEKLLRYDP
jgi:hypothetical protein